MTTPIKRGTKKVRFAVDARRNGEDHLQRKMERKEGEEKKRK